MTVGVAVGRIVQRVVRLGLALAMGLLTLGLLALAPVSAMFSLPPAMVTGGLTVWMCQPPEVVPRPVATRLVAWGLGLTVAEVVVAVLASRLVG